MTDRVRVFVKPEGATFGFDMERYEDDRITARLSLPGCDAYIPLAWVELSARRKVRDLYGRGLDVEVWFLADVATPPAAEAV